MQHSIEVQYSKPTQNQCLLGVVDRRGNQPHWENLLRTWGRIVILPEYGTTQLMTRFLSFAMGRLWLACYTLADGDGESEGIGETTARYKNGFTLPRLH